ncbi:PH domain-containing protein [Arthrobacter sp. 35W]|uniref:PH domain-containing protein n=1 Tax=Arthrobacter sp. 35W TaxID=1132441 RepID=UPI0003FBB7B7|nr:PH domain-containing protein [Arthrobacter sp. 35W]
MIDFNNASFAKLGPCDMAEVGSDVSQLMIQGENLLAAFKGIRDYVVFTDKRLIAVNVQGMTGKKRDYTSMPYSKIQSFSVETAGTFDLDAELDLWFSGLGKVRLEFKSGVDIRGLSRLIATHAL